MITTRKELVDVLVIPYHPIPGGAYEQNVVKRVTYNVITYDTTKDDQQVTSPITSVLSAEDLANGLDAYFKEQ